MGEILIPAEKWEPFTKAYSADLATEHKGGKPLSVRTVTDHGIVYTAFAVCYGRYGLSLKTNSYRVEAWRLVLEAAYDGVTTEVYHDAKAIEAGLRERGDMTGLVVLVRGKRMVCAESVLVYQDLPGAAPLTIAEAIAYDNNERGTGWRSLMFKNRKPKWFSLCGHPVARYRGEIGGRRTEHTVLYWSDGKTVGELSIGSEVPLTKARPDQVAGIAPLAGELQLALF